MDSGTNQLNVSLRSGGGRGGGKGRGERREVEGREVGGGGGGGLIPLARHKAHLLKIKVTSP